MLNGYSFTHGVRDVLRHARDEAHGLGHEYIGTEHFLLALVRTPDPMAAEMLRELAVDRDAVRTLVENTVKRGRSTTRGTELPYTSRGKKTLELAMEAAREFGHQHVGTEHLLLGLVRERNGIGGQVLTEHGVTESTAWNAIVAARATEANTPGETMHSRGVPKVPVKRIVVEVQHADGRVARRECDTTRDAILFLLRS